MQETRSSQSNYENFACAFSDGVRLMDLLGGFKQDCHFGRRTALACAFSGLSKVGLDQVYMERWDTPNYLEHNSLYNFRGYFEAHFEATRYAWVGIGPTKNNQSRTT